MNDLKYHKTKHIRRNSFSWGWQADFERNGRKYQAYIHWDLKKKNRVVDIFLIHCFRGYLIHSLTPQKRVSTCKNLVEFYIHKKLDKDLEEMKENFEELK